jgi:hypothetical protein
MLLAVLAVGCLMVVAAPTASAQIRWGVGAGLVMPMGDYGDADKLGFTGGVGGTYWMTGGQLGIRGELSFSSTSEKSGIPPHKTRFIGGMASVVYGLGAAAASARPYVLGGLGLYSAKIDITGGPSGSETKLAFGGGLGVSFKMGTGGSRIFAEARYMNVTTDPALAYIPIIVGISFGQ